VDGLVRIVVDIGVGVGFAIILLLHHLLDVLRLDIQGYQLVPPAALEVRAGGVEIIGHNLFTTGRNSGFKGKKQWRWVRRPNDANENEVESILPILTLQPGVHSPFSSLEGRTLKPHPATGGDFAFAGKQVCMAPINQNAPGTGR
jgi:hypothetical protein